jgi:hypothetical protein
MAMPFIFGNHRCPFLNFRSMSSIEIDSHGCEAARDFCLNLGEARERSMDRDRATTTSQAKRSAGLAIVRKFK